MSDPFEFSGERLSVTGATEINCPSDCGAGAPLAHLFLERAAYRLSDTVVSTVSGAAVQTGGAAGPFFIRESITWPFESIVGHGLDIPDPETARVGPQGDVVVFPASGNYYHWLIEELPLVLRAHELCRDAVYVADASSTTVKHEQVARNLGFELRRAPAHLRLEQQILPGRADDSWFPHPEDVALLRRFGDRWGDTANSAARIYVSRGKGARALPNEHEIAGVLAAHGFTVVHPGDLPWDEQIRLFRQARIIVGPHGAGLANLVFTHPGATLIELTNGMHYNRCFEFLCHVAGHDYRKVDAPLLDGYVLSTDDLAKRILEQV